MNRRRFLSMLGMVPAALALPALPVTRTDLDYATAYSQYASALSNIEHARKRFKNFHQIGGDDKRRAAMPLDGITMQEGSFITHEPDEWFPGLLIRVEEADDYGYGATIRFVILIDGDESETWALASQKLTPRTKLYGWVKGIDPSLIPDVGEALDTTKLADRRVEVMWDSETMRVGKIRAEKAAKAPIKPKDPREQERLDGRTSGLQKKQAQASAAKKMVVEDPDEAPY